MRKVAWNSLSFIAAMGIAVAIARAQSYPEGLWGFILTDRNILPLLALLAACLLLYGLSGMQFVRKIMWSLFAFVVPPPEHAAKGRLKIHTAFLGNGPNNDRDVRDKLQQLCSNSSLDIVISYQLLIGTDPAKDDPAPGEDKRLLVEYSFAVGPILSTERPQSTRLILPEDPWMLRRIGGLESTSTELLANNTKLTSELADLTTTLKGERQENQRLHEVLQKGVDYSNRQAVQIEGLTLQKYRLSHENVELTSKCSASAKLAEETFAKYNLETEKHEATRIRERDAVTALGKAESDLAELKRIKVIPQLLIQYREDQGHDSFKFYNQGPVAVQKIAVGYLRMTKHDDDDPNIKAENRLEIVPFSGIGLLSPGDIKDNWRFAAKANDTVSPVRDFLRGFLQHGWQTEFSLIVDYEDMNEHRFSRKFVINLDVYSNILFTADAVKIRV